MDRGTCWAAAHGVTKGSDPTERLTLHFHHLLDACVSSVLLVVFIHVFRLLKPVEIRLTSSLKNSFDGFN